MSTTYNLLTLCGPLLAPPESYCTFLVVVYLNGIRSTLLAHWILQKNQDRTTALKSCYTIVLFTAFTLLPFLRGFLRTAGFLYFPCRLYQTLSSAQKIGQLVVSRRRIFSLYFSKSFLTYNIFIFFVRTYPATEPVKDCVGVDSLPSSPDLTRIDPTFTYRCVFHCVHKRAIDGLFVGYFCMIILLAPT